ncbi:two-component system response regulator [Gammaproteobacteria bacterium LSUCC0112]|nr:two-component system response regulator [Gammaproteobacteria bacterium LSUCC0112]
MSDITSQDEKSHQATVLIVDDVAQNLMVLSEVLRDDYRVMVANSGERALNLIESGRVPDIILLDVMMPGIDGYEVLSRLKKMPIAEHIPVIFVTAKNQVMDEAKGLHLGAVDYISKPINPRLLLLRVKAHLASKAYAESQRDRAVKLEEMVIQRTHEIRSLQDVTILALSSMAETRDNETGNHILRTQRYVRAIAEEMSTLYQMQDRLTPVYIDRLFKSAPLHDIGKVGIPDHILLKPGPLTPEEFEIMKTHTTIGYQALVRAERSIGVDLEFLDCAKEIALSHQEKWDGSGYPQGLVGEDIPLSARLMAVADVYDALISRRVYKPPFSHEKALSIMLEGRGTHFDPLVLDAFLAIEDKIIAIAASYNDE